MTDPATALTAGLATIILVPVVTVILFLLGREARGKVEYNMINETYGHLETVDKHESRVDMAISVLVGPLVIAAVCTALLIIILAIMAIGYAVLWLV